MKKCHDIVTAEKRAITVRQRPVVVCRQAAVGDYVRVECRASRLSMRGRMLAAAGCYVRHARMSEYADRPVIFVNA